MSVPGGPPESPDGGDGASTGERTFPPRWAVAAGVIAAVVVVAAAGWMIMAGKPHNASTAPSTSGQIVTADTVKQVLLNGAELTKMLNQPFKKTTGPTKYGGLTAMGEPSTIGDCVGVVDVATRVVYESANVQSYARQTWSDLVPGDPGFKPLSAMLMFADEAVVALPSAADAQALFAKFSERWKQCDGQAVNQQSDAEDPNDPPPLPGSEMHINSVRVSDDVLAASVVLDQKPDAPDTRAIGVQDNCIVEVLLPFTGAKNVPGSAVPATSATEVVRAIMAKIDKQG